MGIPNDIRISHDLNHEVSPWFWSVVDQGKQNRDLLANFLQRFSREELVQFQTELEKIASLLQCPPFCSDSLPVTTQMDEAAQWAVSQGKQLVADLWAHPISFAAIVQNWNDEMLQSSYESVAVNVYLDKYGEEMPPLKFSF